MARKPRSGHSRRLKHPHKFTAVGGDTARPRAGAEGRNVAKGTQCYWCCCSCPSLFLILLESSWTGRKVCSPLVSYIRDHTFQSVKKLTDAEIAPVSAPTFQIEMLRLDTNLNNGKVAPPRVRVRWRHQDLAVCSGGESSDYPHRVADSQSHQTLCAGS